MNPQRITVLTSKTFRVERFAQMRDPRVERLGELIVAYSLGARAGPDPPDRRAAGGGAARGRALPRGPRRRSASVHERRARAASRAPGQEGERRAARLPLADRRRARSSSSTRSSPSGRRRTRARSPASHAGTPPAPDRLQPQAREAALGAHRRRRAELVRRRLPDERARPGRRDVARGVRALRLPCLPRRGRRGSRSRTGRACATTCAAARTRSPRRARSASSAPTPTSGWESKAGAGSPRTGIYNMPDGEVYTSPLETLTEGEIRFTLPRALPRPRGRGHPAPLRRGRGRGRRGRPRPRVPRGAARRRRGRAPPRRGRLRAQLRDRPLHAATRSSTRRSAGRCTSRSARRSRSSAARTTSALHWDLVCDLRADGEVYADGELIWKAGHFLEQPQPARV